MVEISGQKQIPQQETEIFPPGKWVWRSDRKEKFISFSGKFGLHGISTGQVIPGDEDRKIGSFLQVTDIRDINGEKCGKGSWPITEVRVMTEDEKKKYNVM